MKTIFHTLEISPSSVVKIFRILLQIILVSTTAGCVSDLNKSINAPVVPVPSSAIILQPSTTPVSTHTPVFVDLRENMLPSLYIVYWSQRTWYIKRLNDADAVKLMPNVTSSLNTNIQLAPDGDLVAFSNTNGQVSVYDFRTGQLRSYNNPSVNNIFEIKWANNGKTLFYLGTPEETWIPDSYVGLYSISLVTGEAITIIEWKNSEFKYGLRGLTLSKDGRWLAFYAPKSSEMMLPTPEYTVYLIDISCLQNHDSCNESMRLVDNGHSPTWSPNGRLGWVCSAGSQTALCTGNVATTEIGTEVFLSASDLSIAHDAKINNFSWSPDGSLIAINLHKNKSGISTSVTKEVLLLLLNESKLINITDTSDTDEAWVGWSPDSKYLAYTRTLGYTEPYGEIGVRSPVTDLYIYDIQNEMKIDLVSSPGDREVFGFFVFIK